ncbi:Crp/Fnr family transcriptional regulator [Solitalea longa]|uniref:Crp/Fnr family transcriptional regulator n=1 Tax=Solitalea longa TaxID=2079460 RepID=A0A2S5A9G0_9SPHI|nr:Crp/Fnr family transcriptional regulator [Solitalea longa]POY39208.1 Crp/Fnr family transcriptional regulator [Solitalea longa]
MHEHLRKQIENIATFQESDLLTISDCFKSHMFDAKQYILEEGKIASDIHFIISGLVRVYYYKDGKEITTYMACDDGFVSSYSSFINQSKSVEYIQCLEKTEALSISFPKMQELYEKIPQWQAVGRRLAEQNYICMANRVLQLQGIPAREKYLDFLSTSPKKIIQRAPLIHIASFLGITPESLSRIRKSIS